MEKLSLKNLRISVTLGLLVIIIIIFREKPLIGRS